MPKKETTQRARADKRQGKSASTQAGEFVREEIHHVREGKHGARNTKQAIAIGLSKARRSGVDLPAPESGKAPEKTRTRAKRDTKEGQSKRSASGSKSESSTKRSEAATKALRREPKRAASAAALSTQGKKAAGSRTKKERSEAAKKGARTRKRNQGGKSKSS